MSTAGEAATDSDRVALLPRRSPHVQKLQQCSASATLLLLALPYVPRDRSPIGVQARRPQGRTPHSATLQLVVPSVKESASFEIALLDDRHLGFEHGLLLASNELGGGASEPVESPVERRP